MESITLTKKKDSELKTFLRYLLPSMFAMALVAVYTFTDTFVVGRKLGAIALGAMGICTPVITIAFALGFMFGIGGGSLYSISRGRKEFEKANSYFTTSALSALLLGTILAVLGNIFIEPFARFLGADNENITYVLPYLRCLLIYIPGFLMDQLMSCFVRNDGHPKVAMTAIAVGTGLNVILDFLFVFGFEWGMFGAAFATCLCSFITIMINFGYTIWKRLNIRIQAQNVDFKKSWEIIKSGFSVFVLESSSGIVTFVFIMQSTMLYGTQGASIYTIVMNWTLITVNMVLGVTQAAQPLISLSYGSNEYDKMYTFRKFSVISGLILGVIYLTIGYGFTESLVRVFATDSEQLIVDTVFALRLYLPAYLLMSLGICIGIYYQSIQSAVKSLTIMLLRGIALPVIAIILFSLFFGKTGLWLAIPFAELSTAVLSIVFVATESPLVCPANASVDTTDSLHRVITISRQFGSGGSSIGKKLADRLHIPVYDKEVNELTAQASGYNKDMIAMEENSTPVPYGLFISGHYVPISHQIFTAQSKSLEKLASKGTCVIIGRCAEHILKGKANLINVFVFADKASRIQRIMDTEHLSYGTAQQKIEEYDRARAEYHDYFTNTVWGKMENYDITLNSDKGIDACVDTLYTYMQAIRNHAVSKQ